MHWCVLLRQLSVFFVLSHSASGPDACLHFAGWKVCPDPSHPHPRLFKVSLFRLFDSLCDSLTRENVHAHEFGKNFYFTLFTQCVCYVVYQMCLLRCLPNVFVTLFTRCVCVRRYMLKNASSLFSLADYGIAPPEYHRKAIWLVGSEHFILLTEGQLPCCRGNSSRQCIAELVEGMANKAMWTQTLNNSCFNKNCACVNELCSHY